jgi:hypothetical protein
MAENTERAANRLTNTIIDTPRETTSASFRPNYKQHGIRGMPYGQVVHAGNHSKLLLYGFAQRVGTIERTSDPTQVSIISASDYTGLQCLETVLSLSVAFRYKFA